MNQLDRITHMEESLHLLTQSLCHLTQAAEEYLRLQPRLLALAQYYSSPLWRQDFEDDAAGKLPPDLRRGVLSEDGIYNFLSDHADLLELLSQFEQH